MQPLRPYEKEDTLRQFLQFDRNVLRFYCLWDDNDRSVLYLFGWMCSGGWSHSVARLIVSIE